MESTGRESGGAWGSEATVSSEPEGHLGYDPSTETRQRRLNGGGRSGTEAGSGRGGGGAFLRSRNRRGKGREAAP
nr:unnamed protein product [Digitaria exilis]